MKKLLKYILVLLLVGLIYNFISIKFFKVNRLELQSGKLAGEIRISQITDYHNNSLINNKKLVEKIEEFQPDCIVLTGDIIDRDTEDLKDVENFLKALKRLNRDIYFVYGNHELSNDLLRDFTEILQGLEINILEDEIRELEIKKQTINLAGVSYCFSSENINPKLNFQNDNYSILLSHCPKQARDMDLANVDLVLSGHTHGGQVRLPIIGGLIAPNQGFFPSLDKGYYRINETDFYIDSGLGNSVLPIRFLNRVGISNIRISDKN